MRASSAAIGVRGPERAGVSWRMRIGDLIHGLNVHIAQVHGGERQVGTAVRICDITEDSRTVMPGSLFIARAGEKADGKRFIPSAIEAGASAILTDDPRFTLADTVHGKPGPIVVLQTDDVPLAIAQLAERFYGNPSSKMTVIGVTGTNGKTTTTFLIHQMLNRLGVRCGLVGTVVIDDGTEVAPATMTTPPALELSRTLARMHEAGCKAVVMETSSHALHQRRVGGPQAIGFHAGVFTNLTGDHLDYHGTMENYADAKAMLFAALPPASGGGVAIVNTQDPWHTRMVRDCSARIARCAVDEPGALPIAGGTAPKTVWRARVVAADTTGTDVELSGPWSGAGVSHTRIRVPLVGGFNVMNALQALVTVHALFGGTGEDDLSLEIITRALQATTAPPGRLEPVTPQGAPIDVFVDYAHTDDALKTVLTVLRDAMARRSAKRGGSGGDAGGGRLWCVFGCGGDRDRTKRPRMGRVAAELADRVVITSDNPRTERAESIIAEILSGMGDRAGSGGVEVEPDRQRAIERAIREAHPGDVVIIAGKGHEDYQILPDPSRPGGTITRPFDDRAVSRSALVGRGLPVRADSAEHTRDQTHAE